MRRGLYEWVVLAALAGSVAYGGGGGVFVVDGVPQDHAGLANVTYVDARVWALSVEASNALQRAVSEAMGRYPVFELRLGGAWTDFEIKASTNNFAGGDMVYFYASGNANDYGADDPDPYTYYCDDFAADVRKWVAVAPHTAVATVLKNPLTEVETVYFSPSRNCQKAADGWMWKTNTNLVWSWVRYGAIGYETNATGTASHWNPIRPQSWEISRTVP
jgi:hypothetical protein